MPHDPKTVRSGTGTLDNFKSCFSSFFRVLASVRIFPLTFYEPPRLHSFVLQFSFSPFIIFFHLSIFMFLGSKSRIGGCQFNEKLHVHGSQDDEQRAIDSTRRIKIGRNHQNLASYGGGRAVMAVGSTICCLHTHVSYGIYRLYVDQSIPVDQMLSNTGRICTCWIM